MDTRQLAAFCAVVERKSFSQAAERLGVTQPAVSLQIRSLEQRLGRQLLDRSGRRVEPTEAGLRLYASAQRLLALEDQLLEDVVGDEEGELTGTLELGASTGPGGAGVRRLRPQTSAHVIVRWGLAELGGVLDELGTSRPLLVASPRWSEEPLPIQPSAAWTEVPSHRIAEAAEQAGDGVVALGGGSAIDLGKAISAEADVPLVSVPTTYAGAEWTPYFGVRDPDRKLRGGGAGAHLAGVVYEPRLTLSLPCRETVGTALNALAHCAEALYVQGRNDEADADALEGARLIGEWLPQVVDRPDDLAARTRLFEGAMHAGMALGKSMLALAHAMAQALGGRYGLPHGAMNALSLPAALRFNEQLAPDAVRRFGEALGTNDPAGLVEELARLGGFERLRDFGVPEHELPEVAEATAQRAGNQANPRPATPSELERLLREIW